MRPEAPLTSLAVTSPPTSPDTAQRLPTVLFVSSPPGLGGSNISLATVMTSLQGRVHRILAGPAHGAWGQLVEDRELADERLILRGRRRWGRIRNALHIAWFAYRRRASLDAIHANATTGLFLAALASRVAKVRIAVWVHDPTTSPTGLRVGRFIRWLLRDVHYAAVTEVAAQVAVQSGLCDRADVRLIPNPIAPEEVVAERRVVSDRVIVGFLGSATHRKGFDILADVVGMAHRSNILFRLFTSDRRDAENQAAWEALDELSRIGAVDVAGVDTDVRRVYAQCDIVFNPSRDESFCRVAAEAMANGIPVVAGDIPALRSLLGDNEAGLLYPVEDREAATRAVQRLADDPSLRQRMGAAGVRRAVQFEPESVIESLVELYGLSPSTSK